MERRRKAARRWSNNSEIEYGLEFSLGDCQGPNSGNGKWSRTVEVDAMNDIGGVGVLSLNRGWAGGNGADIYPASIIIRCRDCMSKMKNTADGGDTRRGCRDYFLAGWLHTLEQGFGHNWCGRSTNYLGLQRTEIWTVAAVDATSTIVWPSFDVMHIFADCSNFEP